MANTQIVLDKTGYGNVALYSEQFDNAVWARNMTYVSSNLFTAPDGTQTANRVYENGGTGNHVIWQNITSNLDLNAEQTVSISVKASGRNYVRFGPIAFGGTAINPRAYFDLASGTLVSSVSTSDASITDLGDGWYRLSVTGIAGVGATSSAPTLYLQNASGTNTSYTGDGTSGVLVWGAQASQGGPDNYVATTSSPAYRVWVVPEDWDNERNKIHLVGAGGRSKGVGPGGAGAGAYAGDENLTLSIGDAVLYHVGDGATDVDAYDARKDTWFISASTLKAQGGQGQSVGPGSPRVSGGLAANSRGSVVNDGGKGGAGVISPTRGGFGAGAGGPHGAGRDGSDGDGVASGTGTDGYSGASDNGMDADGVTYNEDANPGTQWDGVGPGSGGAPGPAGSGISGSPGGLYGGGAAGPTVGDSSTFIAGGNGVIVITWSVGPQTYYQSVSASVSGNPLARRANTRSLRTTSAFSAAAVIHRLYPQAVFASAYTSELLRRATRKNIRALGVLFPSAVPKTGKVLVAALIPSSLVERTHFAKTVLLAATTPAAHVLRISTRAILALSPVSPLMQLLAGKPLRVAAGGQSMLDRGILAVRRASATGTATLHRAILFRVPGSATVVAVIKNLTTRALYAVTAGMASLRRLTAKLVRGEAITDAMLSRRPSKWLYGAVVSNATLVWRWFPIAPVKAARMLFIAWQDRVLPMTRDLRRVVIPSEGRQSSPRHVDREKKEKP